MHVSQAASPSLLLRFVTNLRSGRYIPGGDANWSREKVEQLSTGHCALGRCAQPQDIARVVSFLASDDGGWVNGKCKEAISGKKVNR